MEPWEQEQLRQLQFTARRMKMPRCQCCDGRIWTERYLELAPFGLQGYACARCVEANMGDLEALEEAVS